MPQSDITPNRSTTLYCLVDETVLIEPAWKVFREGSNIAPAAVAGQTTDPNHNGCRFFPSLGAWQLAPIQDEISNIHEYTDSYSLTLRTSGTSFAQLTANAIPLAIMTEQPFWAKAELLDAAYSASIADSGDFWFIKKMAAGGSLAPSLISGAGTPPGYTSIDVPMDRIGLSNSAYPADQGFFWRWRLPGHQAQHPKFILGITCGQWYVSFGGSGMARLFEYCNDSTDNAVVRLRDTWRYCRPNEVADAYHNIGVMPMFGPKGERYLLFINNALDTSTQISATTKGNSTQQTPSEHVYYIDRANRHGDQDMSPGHVTQSAKVAFDVRRDLFVGLQISTYGYATTGTLVDQPAQLPDFTDTTNSVYAQMSAIVPSTTTLTPSLLDADTNTAYSSTTKRMYAKFVMTGDGHTTPTLWNYQLNRAAGVETISPGQISSPVTSVNLTGTSGEPSQETGHVVIKDVTGQAFQLSNLGQFSVKLVVTDTATGFSSVLFQGYGLRPTSAQRRAKGKKRGAFGIAAAAFPSDDWRNYNVPMVGMWQRLQEVDFLGQEGARYRDYNNSQWSPYENPGGTVTNLSPSQSVVPWLVSDGIKDLLYQAGFTGSQVAIPACTVRLWGGQTQATQDNVVGPTTNLADTIIRWCTNYLAASLVWDANHGTDGAWTLLFPPPILTEGTTNAYTPVWEFSTAATAWGQPAVGDGTALIFGMPEFSVTPPEFNVIRVCAGVTGPGGDYVAKFDRYLFNHNSFHVPGSSVTPTATHPDWLGRRRELTVIDPTLVGTTDADTQYAVDFTARRLFDVLAHGQRTASFTAPLCFYLDPATGNYRPLRHFDPISIDGDASWVIRCVNPSYTRDGLQWASYEAVQPVAKQVFHAGKDGLDFYRKTQKRSALRATGHVTHSHLHGNLSVAANSEQRILSLPSHHRSRAPLQNADGTFIPVAGYDARTGASG